MNSSSRSRSWRLTRTAWGQYPQFQRKYSVALMADRVPYHILKGPITREWVRRNEHGRREDREAKDLRAVQYEMERSDVTGDV